VIILSKNGTSEGTYLNHAVNREWWRVDMDGMTGQQILKELGNRLICKRCEAVIARHNGRKRGKCDRCGWEGETITLDEMLTQQLYRR